MKTKKPFLRTLIAFGILAPLAGYCSTRVLMGADQPDVTTSFGTFSPDLAQRICHSNYLFIGKIQEVKSFWHGGQGAEIYSKMRFQVERPIHGNLGTYRYLTVPGGRIGTVSQDAGSLFPVPEPGVRYLMGIDDLSGPRPVNWPTTAEPIYLVVWMDPNETLPSLQELQDNREELCDAASN